MELGTEVNLRLFLITDLVVDLICDLLGSQVLLSRYTVNRLGLAICIGDEFVRSSGRLVKQEGSLDLVLALLVARRRFLNGNIPAVIVDISRVAATVRSLRLRGRYGLIGKALADHEEPVPLLELLRVLTNYIHQGAAGVVDLFRQLDRLIPFNGLCA